MLPTETFGFKCREGVLKWAVLRDGAVLNGMMQA